VTLKEICQPITDELNEFEEQFKLCLNSNVLLLNNVVEYIIAHKGKRLRPVLVFITANMVGRSTDATIKAALLIELLHTATLLHDDVVDESELRRGGATINKTWQNKIAILAGDYLFATVLQMLVELEQVETFKILSEVTRRMSGGELLQIERSRDYSMEEAVYFQLISDKTASLLAASCQLGGLTSNPQQNPTTIDSLKNLGEYLGIAFQIKDDLLDYDGDVKIIGKPTGNDIIENKITLPLSFALKNADQKERQKIIKLFENGNTENKVEIVKKFVRKNGGITYAEERAVQYIQKAGQILVEYPDSEYKTALISLMNYVTQREK
jgi:octaprenyl-diphosphate synthase